MNHGPHPRRFAGFEDFWPYYVGEHRRPACRAVHYVAGVAAVALVGTALVLRDVTWLLLAPIVAYGLAWLAHWLVEHNRPATWQYVGWSLRAEFRMLLLAARGKMSAEVTRLYGRPDPQPDAPLLQSRQRRDSSGC